MVDSGLNPYLLEVNTNPAIFTNTKNLELAIKPVVFDTLDLVLDLHDVN